MKALLSFFYIVVCVLLIFFILLQNNKGAQVGAGASHASQSLFGSAGSKGFLYTGTKILVALFFILAFCHTAIEYRAAHQVARKTSFIPLEHITQKAAP